MIKSFAFYLRKYPKFRTFLKKYYFYFFWTFGFTSRNFFKLKYKIIGENIKNSFFGYYDFIPIRNNRYLFNGTSNNTFHNPENFENCGIYIEYLNLCRKLCDTRAFNWQQGARLIWINDDEFIFNDYEILTDSYVTKKFNILNETIVNYSEFAIQACNNFGTNIFINYKVLRNLRPDYGYHAHKEFEYNHDEVYFYYGKHELTKYYLRDFITSYCELVGGAKYKFNHFLFNPFCDNEFIFLIRKFDLKGVKNDFLFHFKNGIFKLLKCGLIISHYAYLNKGQLILYCSDLNSKLGWYIYDITLDKLERIDALADFGDGHPSVQGNSIFFDQYPNKFGFAKLFVTDLNSVDLIASIRIPLKYRGQNRCDFHPRFLDGKLFIDCILNDKRKLIQFEIEEDSFFNSRAFTKD